jgi:hypothetical protein
MHRLTHAVLLALANRVRRILSWLVGRGTAAELYLQHPGVRCRAAGLHGTVADRDQHS